MADAVRTEAAAIPKVRHAPNLAGYSFLAVTVIGWGLNWPATKFMLQECPPLTARGVAGIAACLVLATLAVLKGESLKVPPQLRARLAGSALLNVSAWMGLTTMSLVWLRAGEAATLAYTMPVWAAALAWPVLGERLSPHKIAALALGVSGIAILLSGAGFSLSASKIPGVAIALSAAVLFALGTVTSKRWPLDMPPLAMTAWQIGIGCLILLGASLVLEQPHLLHMRWFGWAALLYTAAISLGICYITWFAALRRLAASTAAIGTLVAPVVGVLASSATLGEPLMAPQIASLALVVAGVVLAVRY